MPVSEVKVGMTGYGKTVFSGTKLETFGVEVIAILKNISPKNDAILVRCNHHITDKATIIQGMSGSPVYLVVDAINEPEGHMIGALAFGWGFSKEPIAGVTPIESMLKEMNKPLEQDIKKEDDSDSGWYPDDTKSNSDPVLAINPNAESGALRPLLTPLFVSGMSPKLMPYLEQDLKKFNLYPIQSGGGSSGITVTEPIEPGSAMGVTFVRGDIEWTGIGTVTYVDGDKLLGFGHQMDLAGETSLPMTAAYIYGVMPMLSMSFKLGVGAQEIGSLVQDRKTCVSGIMGKKTPMFPLHIKMTNLKTGFSEDYNMEVIHHKSFTPYLIRSAIANVIIVNEPNDERTTIEATMSLKVKGFEAVTFRRYLASANGVIWPVLGDLVSKILGPLWNNPYRDIMLENVDVDLKVLNEDRTAVIKNIWLEKDTVKPGELVRVYAKLQPYKKPEFTAKPIQFIIPEDTPDQDINIVVTGGEGILPELPTPRNPAEMMNLLKSLYESDNIITVVPLRTTNLLYNGRKMEGLPNSFLSSLINQSREDVAVRDHGSASLATLTERYELINGVLKIFNKTDYIIKGADNVRLKVRKK